MRSNTEMNINLLNEFNIVVAYSRARENKTGQLRKDNGETNRRLSEVLLR